MRILFSFCLLIYSFGLNAQGQFLGFKGGLSWTDITSSNFLKDRDFRFGNTFGLTYDSRIKDHLTYGIELIYNQRGFSSKLNLNEIYGGQEAKNDKLEFNYNYISLPIKVGFDYGHRLFALAHLGLAPSVLIKAQESLPTIIVDTIVIPSKLTNVTGRANRFDLAAILDLGAGYKLYNNSFVFASFSFLRSLTSITNKYYYEGRNIKHYGFMFNVGLKFELTRD